MKQTNEKQKKLLLMLPLLVLPFITLLFWALGGGKTAQAQSATAQVGGLNMKVPGAKLKNDSLENKLGFYEQAQKDSLKNQQARKDDPYYKADTTRQPGDTVKRFDTGIAPKTGTIGRSFTTRSLSNSSASLAANEQQINQRLSALNRQISQPSPTVQQQANSAGSNDSEAEIRRLQAIIQKSGTSGAADPQMDQISTMLDKIQEIQNPALVRQKLKAQSEKERGIAFPVSGTADAVDQTIIPNHADTPDNRITYFDTPRGNGFYDLDNNSTNNATDNAIEAVVHETRTLTTGSTIKLRLLQDIYINGRLIPKSTFVFGSCSVEGERLNIDIRTISVHNSVFPVSMKVFDRDGIPGICVPGAIGRDAAKDGVDQAMQSYDPLGYSPSVGAQAASAGIQVAKGFFSKKVKLVKVTVKAGYNVLLLNNNQLNN
ncbi:conjugative transposon TraM protein [Mucilaginibacter gracilis]|uniref:Conjugative transposon TraM protein n=1 Tax=Mucilaginibacter gracilis TaxID=423350 RepID=A0A495IXT2_9SPHI|nr:conjugative transposon protein TraM [Mucilaginibacter gracilis]RKR80679.1 conjugative transposon TraM protein [Mucilaginibacter gracilis]